MSISDPASRIIPEHIVEAAYIEIGGLSDDQANLHMQRLSRSQPALLAFVTANSEDLRQDAGEFAVYLFVVVVQMFEMHFGKRLQIVGMKRIESIHKENENLREHLSGASEAWLERLAGIQSQSQPWVWEYVIEGLFEPDDPDLQLSDEDVAALAIIIKTVIDALVGSVR